MASRLNWPVSRNHKMWAPSFVRFRHALHFPTSYIKQAPAECPMQGTTQGLLLRADVDTIVRAANYINMGGGTRSHPPKRKRSWHRNRTGPSALSGPRYPRCWRALPPPPPSARDLYPGGCGSLLPLCPLRARLFGNRLRRWPSQQDRKTIHQQEEGRNT